MTTSFSNSISALVALALSAGGSLHAQSVRVVNDVLVDATPARAITEPHLAVDPRNPEHLLAAVMVTPPLGATTVEQTCAAFSSFDGGAHWTRHDFPIRGCYDPWVAFLPDGGALFSSLGGDLILAGEGNGLLVYRSPDGGKTWVRRPAGLSWGWDHPMTVVDHSATKQRGWVYMVSSRDLRINGRNGTFAVAVSRSVDGGKSFDVPRNIAPENQIIKAEPPVVLSDGTLVVPYVEVAGAAGFLLDRRRAWLVRSNNGIDFSRPTYIGDACGQPPAFQVSSFAVDASGGPFQNRMYFTCTVAGFSGIAVTHSADGGATWSRPVSAAGNPRDSTYTRVLMATAVSSDGVVGVVWLRRAKTTRTTCREVYFSASFDGGQTFTRGQPVSTAPSCPSIQKSGPHGGYGDYSGLVGDSRGRFRLAFSDARTGLFQLRTALIEVSR